MSAVIIRFALWEGAALLNIVAYIVAGQIWSLAIAGVPWLLTLVMLPGRTSFEHRLESQSLERPGEFRPRSE